MPTATALANGAARDLGILDSGGSLSAAQLTDALTALNQVLDNWSIEGRMAFAELVTTVAVTNPTVSYALGTRYVAIKAATAKPSSGTQSPLEICDAEKWGSIPDKGVAGSVKRLMAQAVLGVIDPVEYSQFTDPNIAATIQRLALEKPRPDLMQVAVMIANLSTGNTFQSRYLYYDHNSPTGTIYLAGPPQTGNVEIIVWVPLTTFADLTTPVTLPPGYEAALRLSLAEMLAPEYSMTFSPEAKARKDEAMATIQRLNVNQPVGPALKGQAA